MDRKHRDIAQNEWPESPRKRRRSSGPHLINDNPTSMIPAHRDGRMTPPDTDGQSPSEKQDKNITIASTAKMAPEAITPFLAKNIPLSYAPLGATGSLTNNTRDTNSKFCYRHRPDMLCRKSADEPTMDQLQKVCSRPATSEGED